MFLYVQEGTASDRYHDRVENVAPVGVLMAGGTGSRLAPLTTVVNKHLLPVFDKPMIFFSLSTLMLAGIRDILLVSDPYSLATFGTLFGEGNDLGLNLSYVEQTEPLGIAHGLLSCGSRIRTRSTMLVLGDNLLFGSGLRRQLRSAFDHLNGAKIFSARVSDVSGYGVVDLSQDGSIEDLMEKPRSGGPGQAVVGLYVYDASLLDVVGSITPSHRGELEITDVNRAYWKLGRLGHEPLARGTFWQDLGTIETLHRGAEYVRLVETRTGQKVVAPEEIAWRNGWIDSEELLKHSARYGASPYGAYLSALVAESESRPALWER